MASVLELACAQQLLEGCLITLTASTSKGLDPADATSYVFSCKPGGTMGPERFSRELVEGSLNLRFRRTLWFGPIRSS
jgi:hypothetical protein